MADLVTGVPVLKLLNNHRGRAGTENPPYMRPWLPSLAFRLSSTKMPLISQLEPGRDFFLFLQFFAVHFLREIIKIRIPNIA